MKILVAMSGGVDSTVSAYILKKQGHEVIGVNFAFADVGATGDAVGASFASPRRRELCERQNEETDTIRPRIGDDSVGADTIRPVVGASFASPRRRELCERQNEEVDTIRPCMGELCEPELEEIAKKLDIKIIYRDYRDEFKNKIIDSFVCDYEHGITPNPCVICNGTMKFEKLLQVMREENCDMVATGHYANVVGSDANAAHTARGDDAVGADTNAAHTVRGDDVVGAKHCEPAVGADTIRPHMDDDAQTFCGDDAVGADTIRPRYCIKKSDNQQKDQSYMLYRLNQDQLSHIIFPIGNMDKTDVRKIASELGLKVADKKDSQDVCFIKNISYQEFIKRYEFGSDYREKIANGKLKEAEIFEKPYLKKGEFVDANGNVLGFHNGIINYTIGQRKGLNIAFGERKFVSNIDIEKNQVLLSDNEGLFRDYFFVSDIVFSGMSETKLNERIKNNESFENVGNRENKKLFAKLRYRHEATLCKTIESVDIDELSSSEKNNLKYYFDKNINQLILKCHVSEPIRAITPGQSAVFYDESGQVMFGGRIL